MAAGNARNTRAGARILVVDDSRIMRHSLRMLLEQHEAWKVCGEASTGREAVERAQQASPDLILLDFHMPDMNGLDAAREIRRRLPRVPILMVTLHMSSQLEDQAKQVGIVGACDKCNIDSLLEGVDTVLHKGTYYRH